MAFKTFNKNKFDFMTQPMFFGEGVNVARFDQQKHSKFEKLTDKQLSFFWRPEEINVAKDANDFRNLDPHQRHMFTSNLRYQTLLDSVQGRAPNAVFLPIVSDPALENWIVTWAFSETIHARSYTHIIRNAFPNPSEMLDSITETKEIMDRAESVTQAYDKLYHLNQRRDLGLPVDEYEHAKALYMCMHSVNALEAIRFYVSFACSFAFDQLGLMTGNASIIKFIARDEALHLSGTQYILREMQKGGEGDLLARVAEDCKEEAEAMFRECAMQEKHWADYLFKDGSMIGLNAEILKRYVDYITDQRMRAVGLDSGLAPIKNPIPWINSYLNSNQVQVTPQEKELDSYLTGAIKTDISQETVSKLQF